MGAMWFMRLSVAFALGCFVGTFPFLAAGDTGNGNGRPLEVCLLRPDSLAGWDHGDPPQGWTIAGGRLSGGPRSTPLLSGYSFGDFDLRLRWSVALGAKWKLRFLRIPTGDSVDLTLSEGEDYGGKFTDTPFPAPGSDSPPPSHGGPIRYADGAGGSSARAGLPAARDAIAAPLVTRPRCTAVVSGFLSSSTDACGAKSSCPRRSGWGSGWLSAAARRNSPILRPKSRRDVRSSMAAIWPAGGRPAIFAIGTPTAETWSLRRTAAITSAPRSFSATLRLAWSTRPKRAVTRASASARHGWAGPRPTAWNSKSGTPRSVRPSTCTQPWPSTATCRRLTGPTVRASGTAWSSRPTAG